MKYEVFIKTSADESVYSIPVFTKTRVDLKDMIEAGRLVKTGKQKLKHLYPTLKYEKMECKGIKAIGTRK